MRRTERLFAITQFLRGRRTGVTVDVLAERFGVSARTIHRDLDSLREGNLPIMTDRGRGGGVALDRSYHLPPVNFTAREAALLLTAGQWLVRLRVLPFVDTLEGALDKVRVALPDSARAELDPLMQSVTYVGVPAQSAPPAVRKVVEQAWFEGASMRIKYDGHRGITERNVRIRGIVMERTETLLNCDDLDQCEPRQFRLHRIVSARLHAVAPGKASSG